MTFVRSMLFVILMLFFAVALISCSSSDGDEPSVVKIEFDELPMPANADEEKMMRVTPFATVTYSDGTTQRVALAYHQLFKTGDSDGQGNSAGLLLDSEGKPIKYPDGSMRFSVQQDATAFFQRGNNYYMLQHFESSPGAVYLVDLKLNTDGRLTPTKYRNVDFSKVGGTVINCSAQKSPWDTFLSAEEDYYFSAYHFDPATSGFDAQNVAHCEKDTNGNFTGKYKAPSFAPSADFSWWCKSFVKPLITDYLKNKNFTPYNYGYIVEIAVDNNGNPSIPNNMKHYVLGKFTPEVAVVSPDNRTVYMLDDGSYTGMFMFVADKEKDLSSGSLYIAKAKQLSPDNTDGGEFEINWIKLGTSNNAKIKSFIDKGVVMSDIFDIANPSNCPSGYTKMYTYDTADAKSAMCIRLRDGSGGTTISPKFANADDVRTAAAFLHPRQYGVLLGGTTEFSKGEGVTYNFDKNLFYFVMSRVEESMTTGKGTKDNQDDIRLKENRCGVIYEGTFGDAKELNGTAINSKYVVRKMSAIIVGKTASANDPGADKNFCAINTIANPDNVLYVGKNLLMIAEDSGFHYNNMMWVYNTETKKITRIATVPPGAEVTGAFGHINIGGKKYIAFNAQHPYGESRRNAAGQTVLPSVDAIDTENLKDEKYKGITGYIFGLPAW
ncbi:MAG: DUF839 domain-containing protein [Thermodesulfovibrionales bacterium]|nr:DUF839 domain-containing protein [Thermodesulfovibrionales bacterium]